MESNDRGTPASPEAGYLHPPPLTRQEIRDLDARAIRDFAIPGLILMENAAEGCVRIIERLLESRPRELAPPFRIICGHGNNGGDGLAMARHLHNRGLTVEVYLTSPPDRFLPGSDAAIQLEMARRMGLPLFEGERFIGQAMRSGTVIDAIFGTGLARPVAAPEKEWIEAIHQAGHQGENSPSLPVLSIDIPSGLDADTGEILGAAVRARHTLTLVAPKPGFYLGRGPECTGLVHSIGISIPRQLLEERRCLDPRTLIQKK